VVEEHQVKVLFTAPTAFRAIKKQDPSADELKKYDISCLQSLYLAGERCDPDTLSWAGQTLGIPVIDHWWQTETGWAIAANPMGIEPLDVKPGSPTVAMPGFDVQVLAADGSQMADGEMGDLAIKLPLAPGCLPTLWGNDQRFIDAYLTEHEGYYTTGDAGYKDADGYLWIMSRTDDVINVAGHRLSTGAIEEALSGHDDVAECAVFGVKCGFKGQLPLGLVVLKDGVSRDSDTLGAELIQRVRQEIGPVAAFKMVGVTKRLPKTRSGKILRGSMAKIADGDEWTLPETFYNPAALTEISNVLNGLGYPKKKKT
jgi:propionyl-CoA synthetase